MTPDADRYAYLQVTGFSGVNGKLRPQLERLLGLRFDVVDVADPRRLGRDVFLNAPWSNLPPMLRAGGLSGLRHPRQVVAERFATARMYDHRTQVARRAVTALRPRLVFQTQTMFDAKVDGVPLFVFTDHTMLANRRYPRPSQDVERRADWVARETATYRAAERIFTASEFARTSLLEDYGCPPEQVVAVGSGTNLDPPAAQVERDRPVRTVLFVGFEWERKGGPLLLEAVRRLQATRPDVRLVVAGCSPAVSGPGVEVLGRVRPEQVADLLRAADVFCMPSWVEPSAGVYLEAAAFELPVVATAVGGTPERVQHERTGLLAPAGDVDALHRHLARLVEEPDTARRLGRAGRQLIEASFTWPVVAERIVGSMREAVPHLLPAAP